MAEMGGAFSIEVGALPVEGIDRAALEEMVALEAQDPDEPAEEDFYANVAARLSPERQSTLAAQLVEDIERDIQSRADWDQQLARGLKELGFDRSDDRKSEPFPGASAVTHPLLAQACVDFQARAIKELFPPNGPVKTRIVGRETPDKRAKADRAAQFMNWQMTERLPVPYAMPEYRSELDSMLMMLPLTGCLFKKPYWDHLATRPCSPYILSEDFIVPYSASSLETTPRATHRLRLHPNEVKRYQKSGLWLDVEIGQPKEGDDISQARTKAEKIEGVNRSDSGEDDRYVIYECHCDLELPEIEESEVPLPFIVTVTAETNQILAIRRNWRKDDPERRRRVWFVKYGCIPWRGFYDIGLLHLIGGLAKAATGALRALMDSAALQTIPGGVRLRGARVSSSSVAFRPMEWTEIDAPGIDDVKKIAMPYPMNGPSSVLFELLGFLVQAGQQFATVATQAAAEMKQGAPVGTTLALIEEGSRVYSAIHARLHFAQGNEFSKLAELNKEHLDDQVVVATFAGELIASWQDFDDEVDIQPVSDPNIFSQIQRAQMANATMELVMTAEKMGLPVNKRAAIIRVAETNKIQGIDELFPEPPQAQPLDPVSELRALTQGLPVRAFPGQAHEAHVGFLMAKAQDPAMGPMMLMIGPRLQALVADHLVMQATEEAMTAVQMATGGQPVPPQIASQIVARAAMQTAQQRVMQAQAQAAQQGPQGDPAAMAEVQRRAARDQGELTLKKEKQDAELAMKQGEAQLDATLRLEETQIDAAQRERDTDVRAAVDRERMATDVALEEMRLASQEKGKAAELAVKVQLEREEQASDERMAAQASEVKASVST